MTRVYHHWKNPNHNPHRRPSWRRFLYWSLGIIAAIIVSLILFIKLDTAAAANFTDQVLRPFIGDANVIALEKIFFNSSDKVNQIKYSLQKPPNPFIENSINPMPVVNEGLRGSGLDFNGVPTTATAPLDGEGQWHDIPLSLFPNQTIIADTFIRPDSSRSYAFATLIQMDMSKLKMWSVAGTVEPGGKAGNPGPGVIPQSVHDQGILVAAFDGGFQYRDGQYGMIVGDTTYLPLKNDLATLVGHNDGRLEIVKYEGQNLGNDVAFVRQNCPMLIENGVIGTQNETNKKLWGRTMTTDIYTWRSGIGITAKGNLIFVAGNALVPSTLAAALKAAGAVNAMQLDINPNWVRFNIFNNFSNNHYTSVLVMQGLLDGSYSYLHGYKKDFFYITKK